jgi:Holliday junction resolvase RusA-like endonuclease
MEASMIRVLIPGEPKAYGVNTTRKGHVYERKGSRNWKATAQQHMMDAVEHRPHFAEGVPVKLDVTAVFPCPKSDHRKRIPVPRRWHTKAPDLSNVLKAVEDAGNAVLWADDRQVTIANVACLIGAQGEAPFIEVVAKGLEAA